MQGSHSHLRAYAWLVVILLAVAGFVYALYFLGVGPQAGQNSSPFPATAPAPTQADQVSAQQSFNYLVSYTVSGFHPTTLTMKVGQTIRFTDNSPNAITIAGASTKSPQLEQGMYWQYTATKTGTVTFTSGNSTITIKVTK